MCAHLHLSWLDPHKERRFTVVGSGRMATFDDMALEGKLTIYDKGFDQDARNYGEYITRSGGMESPPLPNLEPLRLECEHFVQCVLRGERPQSDGESGLRVVRVLEALQGSLERSANRDGAECRPEIAAGGPCCSRERSSPRGPCGAGRGHPRRGRAGSECLIEAGAILGKRPRLRPGSSAAHGRRAAGAVLDRGVTVCSGAVIYAGAQVGRERFWATSARSGAFGDRRGVRGGSGVVCGLRRPRRSGVLIQTGVYVTGSVGG